VTSAVDVVTPALTVADRPLAATWLLELVHVRVERALGLVGRATLRFNDPGYALTATKTFELGAKVTIAAPTQGTLIAGTVTGVTLEQAANEQPQLVVVVDDDSYKLTRGTYVSTQLSTSYADLITTLATQAGLQARVGPTPASSLEYQLQAGSNLEFLNSIVDRIGSVWWFDDGALQVQPAGTSTGTVQVALGEQLSEFSVRASGLRPTKLTVRGWDAGRQANLLGESGAISASAPDGNFVSGYVSSTSALGDNEISVADRSPADQSEANDIAAALFEASVAAAVVARGSGTVNAALQPSVTVRVANAGPASGNYLVSEVEHVYSRSGFVTRFVAGPFQPAGLVDTLGPRPPDPSFDVPGLVIAVVTDVMDPDDTGRAKLRYVGIGGKIESPWARIVSFGAGKGRGFQFQPEVDDEVLVGFERGDTRRPVILGGLYSKTNSLPKSAVTDNQIDYRRITSRLGHVVEIADGSGPDQQHILLQLNGGHRLRVGADRFDIELAAGKPLTIKAGSAKFDISQAGDVTIEGKNVTIKAELALKLQALQSATLEGTTQAAVQGAQVQVKSETMTSVQSGGPVSVKGAIVQLN
jgi:phage baseplate assembly protein gpV/phage protein D